MILSRFRDFGRGRVIKGLKVQQQYFQGAVFVVGKQVKFVREMVLHEGVEYAPNSLTSATTGMSPFECSLGYLPLLFPAQKGKVTVQS